MGTVASVRGIDGPRVQSAIGVRNDRARQALPNERSAIGYEAIAALSCVWEPPGEPRESLSTGKKREQRREYGASRINLIATPKMPRLQALLGGNAR